MRGFSLLEVLIVLGIVALIAGISTTTFNNFRSHENLEIAATSVVEALRHAQANAQSGKGDSAWGVKMLPSSTVIFKGTSYAGRDTAADQPFSFSGGVVASGLSEIVFIKVMGATENTGTVTLTNSYGTKNIEINEKGTLTY